MANQYRFLFTPCAFPTDDEITALQRGFDDAGDAGDEAKTLYEIGVELDSPLHPIEGLMTTDFLQQMDEIFIMHLSSQQAVFGTADHDYYMVFQHYRDDCVAKLKEIVDEAKDLNQREQLVFEKLTAKFKYITHPGNRHFVAFLPLLTPSTMTVMSESFKMIHRAISEVSGDNRSGTIVAGNSMNHGDNRTSTIVASVHNIYMV